MNKYLAVYYSEEFKRERSIEIYADEDVSFEDVVEYYEKSVDLKVGQKNRAGAKLVEIKKEEEKENIRIIDPSDYLY